MNGAGGWVSATCDLKMPDPAKAMSRKKQSRVGHN